MKLLYALPSSFLLLTTLAFDAHSASFDDWGISMMDIRGVSPNPVMEVNTTNGQEYNQAATNELVFKVEAKARCENLHWVNYGQILIYPKNASTIGDNYGNKIVIAKPDINKKTWANDWTPITISFSPNTTLQNQAIAACNVELEKRIAQGGKKADIVKSGFETTMNKTNNQFNFTCSGPSPHANHPKSVENNHPINLKCGSYTPKQAQLVAAVIPVFALKGVDISMTTLNYQGACPTNLPVKAMVSTNSYGGKFEYRFAEDDKPVSDWKEYSVPKNTSSVQLNHTLVINKPDAPAPNQEMGFAVNQQGNAQANQLLEQVPTHKVSIELKLNNQQMSDNQIYQATCKTDPVITPVAATLKLDEPDLTSREGMTIGTKSSPWGGVLNLTKSDAVSQNIRGCNFRFKYDVVNIGKANSGPAMHRLQSNAVLHTEANFAVSKNESRYVSGHIILQPGHHQLSVKLDQPNAVKESNENNNLFSMTVNVADDCGSGSADPIGGPRTNPPGTPPIPGVPPRPGTGASPTAHPATAPAPQARPATTPPPAPTTSAPSRSTPATPARATDTTR